MKFTVDVSDFWIEGEELSGALARDIKNQVVAQMIKTVEQRIDAQITTAVTKVIDSHINTVIADRLTELVDTGTIIKDGKVVALKDHINNVFNSNIGWNNPSNQIAALAKKFGEELKLRYDALFANRIVVKLNEQGMLKDEVVKLLIEGK